MDLTIDVNAIFQALIFGGLVWHGRAMQRLIVGFELHDLRISRIEEKGKVSQKCPD